MTSSELTAKVKAASDKMRADDNTKNALRYLEQLTWLLFLKVFDGLEEDRTLVAEIDGKTYTPVIDHDYRWSTWARSDLTGSDLIEFITDKLLPYLRELAGSTQAERIASIFQEVRTVMKSGYSLKEVVAIVDTIDFHSLKDHHSMSVIYESLLAQTADAGWSGEFYTPRPIVESMVSLIEPQLGQQVYDPCAGSAGFLVGSAEHMAKSATTKEELETLHSRSIFGQEAGDIAALVGTMNLILHGVHDPQIVRRNTLEQDVRNIPPSQQHDVILTNPPFGGSENPQVQQNFPSRSAATELLFLQHCMAKLRQGGRCAIVLPDGVLYRAETAFSTVRRRLLNEFKVTAIVRLPPGVFPTAPDVRTNLVFFERTGRTESIRYYQVPLRDGRRYSKTNPVKRETLKGAEEWIRQGCEDEYSWEVTYDDIVDRGMDLDIPWPNAGSTGNSGADAAERLEQLSSRVATLHELAQELVQVNERLAIFTVTGTVPLGPHIVETGARAGSTAPTRFVGVSNKGGLAPFKGQPAKDTSRYQRLSVGDFVYNPMRANVGSIALCRKEDETGWVSPDYVVFRLLDSAPFDSEFLLFYLKSPQGRGAIEIASRGAVRRRLYYEDLTTLVVPVPSNPEDWEAVIGAFASVRRHLLELPTSAEMGLASLESALLVGGRDDICVT
ncbi:N-6 DNA methylase [Rhodococcus hoagii]|nr:N-6 DNA methylase [Prescottella equi]